MKGWQRIGVFWGLTVSFALLWASLLLLSCGQRPWAPELTRVPSSVQALYLLGLYLEMGWVAWRLKPSASAVGQGSVSSIGQHLRDFALGALLAGASLLGLWLGFGLLGWLHLQPGQASIWLVLQNLGMALGVAWIEEWVFRGFILDSLRERYAWPWSLRWQALLFALPHLLRRDLDWQTWLSAALGLYLTGLLLGRMRTRTGGLSMGYGMHAGWIWLSSTAEQWGYFVWPLQQVHWTGRGNPVYGWGGVFLMGLLVLIFPLPHSLTSQEDLCNNGTTSQ